MHGFQCAPFFPPPPILVQTRTRRMNASRRKLKRNKSTRFNYIHYKWNWLMSDSSEWRPTAGGLWNINSNNSRKKGKFSLGNICSIFPIRQRPSVMWKKRPQQTLVEQSSSWKGQSADSAVWNIYPKSSCSLLENFLSLKVSEREKKKS